MAILKDLIVNGAARILGDTYAGKITATSFVKNGGTSSQFLKADGSVDSNTYLTSATDTKNTTGSTNKTATKMYLVSATEQSANPVTYSNSGCYIGTDNCLYSNSTKVSTTDTKVTDAANASKSFILGHTAQGSNATATTQANAYMTSGKLYSNNSETVNLADTQTVSGIKTFSNGVKFTSASSGYNDKGIIFAGGSRIGENTSGDLGVYGARRVYIRPASPSSASTVEGICITDTDISPTTAASCSLGTSSLYYGGVYSSSFVKNGGTASQFLMANGTTKTLSTTVSQNSTNPVTSGAVWSFCDEFEQVTSAALNYLQIQKQNKLTAGEGIALSQSSGSSVISIAGVPMEVLHTTANSLRVRKNNGQLIPGQWYRITDYDIKLTNSSKNMGGKLQAAHHLFDVLVMALTPTDLDTHARACLHFNEEAEPYFKGCDLSKWELGYVIDDESGLDQYAWGDDAEDGGIITYMKDEFGNECYYDFKNIKMKPCSGGGTQQHNFINTYFYTFSLLGDGADSWTSIYDASVPDYFSTASYPADGSICTNNVIKPYRVGVIDQIPIYNINDIVLVTSSEGDQGAIENNFFDNNCRYIFFDPDGSTIAGPVGLHFGCNNSYINLERDCSYIKIGDGNSDLYFFDSSRIVIGSNNYGARDLIAFNYTSDLEMGNTNSCMTLSFVSKSSIGHDNGSSSHPLYIEDTDYIKIGSSNSDIFIYDCNGCCTSNISIGDGNSEISIGVDPQGGESYGDMNDHITIGDNNNEISLCGDGHTYIHIGSHNMDVVFDCDSEDGGCNNVKIGNLNSRLDIQEGSFDISIDNDCQDINIGYGNEYITVGDCCRQISLGSVNYRSTFGKQCDTIITGSANYDNTFGPNCSSIEFKGTAYGNTFGPYCRYIYFTSVVSKNTRYNVFGPDCNYITLYGGSEGNVFEGSNSHIICNSITGTTWQATWSSSTYSSARLMKECRFLTGASYINACNTTSGSIMRRYTFAASASGWGTGTGATTQFSFTSQSENDSSSSHAVSYYVRRTSNTGTPAQTTIS